MIKNISKNEYYKKLLEFKSFIGLIFLVTLAVLIISSYEKFRYEQSKNLENILQNVYLNKTLKSISSSLNPRFEKVEHRVQAGESFESVLNQINLDKKERKKILDFIINNKIKLKLYENQKLSFQIDNFERKKIQNINIPINKKKRSVNIS